jgi:hypothetical protein
MRLGPGAGFPRSLYSETDVTVGGFGLSYDAENDTDTRSELDGRFDDLTTLNAVPRAGGVGA